MADRYTPNLGSTGAVNDGDAYASNLLHLSGSNVDVPVDGNTLSIIYFDADTKVWLKATSFPDVTFYRISTSFADAIPLTVLASDADIAYLNDYPDAARELAFHQAHSGLSFTRDNMQHFYAGNETSTTLVYDILDGSSIAITGGTDRAQLKNVNYGPSDLRVVQDANGMIIGMQDVYKFSFNGDERFINPKWIPPVATDWYIEYTMDVANNGVYELSGVRSNGVDNVGRFNFGKSATDDTFFIRWGDETDNTISITEGWHHIVLNHDASENRIDIVIDGDKEGDIVNAVAAIPTKSLYYGQEHDGTSLYPVHSTLGFFRKDNKFLDTQGIADLWQWTQDNIPSFSPTPPSTGCEAPNIITDCGFDDENEWSTSKGEAEVINSMLVFNGAQDTVVNRGHTLIAGDTYQVSINCKSLTAGGYTLAIDTPSGVGNEIALGSVLGINPVNIIVPENGDRFRISTYQADGVWPSATFDDFKAEKIDSGTPPVSGVIPNSVDRIWADMERDNTEGYPTAKPSSYGLYYGGNKYSTAQIASSGNEKEPTYSWTATNFWMEIYEMGDVPGTDPQSCAMSINPATNTRVEIGSMKAAYKKKGDNTWYPLTDIPAPNNGNMVGPPGSGLYNNPCYKEDPDDMPNPDFEWVPAQTAPSGSDARNEPEGRISVKPQGQWQYHGYGGWTDVRPTNTFEVMWGQMYVRLIVENDALPDDRDTALFLAKVGSDLQQRDPSYINIAGTAQPRWLKVTKDWQPINMFAGDLTYQDLVDYPPPFISTP